MTQREKLERAYRRQVRNLEQEVDYLRSMLWNETQGTHECFAPEPIPEPRREEETGKTDVDSFVKSMLADS